MMNSISALRELQLILSSNRIHATQSLGSDDDVVSSDEVAAEAEKNKQKRAKNPVGDGAPSAAPPPTTPPAATQSVATAAKFGPFSQTTAILLAGLVLTLGGGAFMLRSR